MGFGSFRFARAAPAHRRDTADIDAAMSSSANTAISAGFARRDCSSALRIPCLPVSAPAAPTPSCLKLALMPHQQRALHRCLLIEEDGALSNEFSVLPPGYGQYKSRGGVLADAVGMGKTAMALSLILAGDGDGPNLVVAPGHLIQQWQAELAKFVDAESLKVLVGLDALRAAGSSLHVGRTVVLVDVQEVVGSAKVWYDFRRVFRAKPDKPDANSKQFRRKAPPEPPGRLFPAPERMALFREAAQFCVTSPLGGCSYEGWVYTSSLHLPEVSWRRVLYDEIQDLVAEGSDSQKNLLQLSRTARNVWLLTATPFPHGNASVFANHELLGFRRLKLDVSRAAHARTHAHARAHARSRTLYAPTTGKYTPPRAMSDTPPPPCARNAPPTRQHRWRRPASYRPPTRSK